MAQVLYLSTIGRDDTHVESLVEDARLADALKVLLQSEQRQFRFSLVDTSKGFAHELLLEK